MPSHMSWHHRHPFAGRPDEPAARSRHRSRRTLAAATTLAVAGGVLAIAHTAAAPTAQAATRAAASAGSATVGTTSYAIPSGAKYVAPGGNDTAAGTASAPWRTVAKAISAAPSGSTVVLRRGSYHESVTVPTGKKLTIQAHPGEPVWFDGSRPVTGWVADGTAWRVDRWTPSFDNSPTYTSGAADSTEQYFGFVNASYPMAAHPDQVFVDGAQLRQVGSRSQVTTGTFYKDDAGDRLYIGTNPSGRAVRASDLTTAVSLRGAGSVLRGVGVQRYATSLPLMGTVRALADGVRLENVVVRDNATQGVFVRAKGVVMSKVTSANNGSMGISGNYADGMQALGVRVTGNNREHFNPAPSAGGFKVTRARGLTVKGSVLSGNDGAGLWFDESVYDVKVTGNDSTGNTRHGMSFEISSKGVFADNLLARNGGIGLKINNANGVQIWNNTVVGNKSKPMWLVQDKRVASNLSLPGHDPRQPMPDPTVTWILGNLTVKNNVFAQPSGNCLVCLEDAALYRSATTIGVRINGNAHHRQTSTSPTYSAIWASGQTNPKVYGTLSAFRTATGQEAHGREFVGASIVDSSYRPTAALLSVEVATAQPLDTGVAALTGRTAGEEHLGAWLG